MYSLVGIDGNAFNIMGYVTNAMREQRMPKKDRDAYCERAMSGDYDNLIYESMLVIDQLNEKLDPDYDGEEDW